MTGCLSCVQRRHLFQHWLVYWKSALLIDIYLCESQLVFDIILLKRFCIFARHRDLFYFLSLRFARYCDLIYIFIIALQDIVIWVIFLSLRGAFCPYAIGHKLVQFGSLHFCVWAMVLIFLLFEALWCKYHDMYHMWNESECFCALFFLLYRILIRYLIIWEL